MALVRSLSVFGLLGSAYVGQASEASDGEVLTKSGEDVHCVGSRAHVLSYEVTGPVGKNLSYQDVKEASITLTPAPEKDVWCSLPPGGDSRVCFGANEDSTCAHAKKDLPLEWGMDCKNCFLGATADVFYSMNYSALSLDHIEVGLRDIHLRSAAAAHAHRQGSQEPKRGELQLENHTFTIIDKEVGCPVCMRVKITVNVPAALQYDLRFKEDVEVTAGAAIDARLGGQSIRWDRSGWKHIKNETTVSVSPLLDMASKGEGDVDLGFKASMLLDVADVMWYRMDLEPSTALRVSGHEVETDPVQAEVCIDGDAAFSVSHEADLHWRFMTLSEYHHWGPADDYTWSKQDVLHKCKDAKNVDNDIMVV